MSHAPRALVIAVLAATVLIACGEETPLVTTKEPAKKAEAAPRATPPTDGGTAEPAFVYAYNPLGKRDPFRSAVEPHAVGKDPGAVLCNEPLCQWDKDQLDLVAVVSGEANPLAMLQDPNKVGHLVHNNTRIGRQGGKVTQILRDCVVITEFWTGPDGKVNPNPVKMCIKYDSSPTAPATDLLNPTKQWE